MLFLVSCSKIKELEEELHVVTNNLRSLEISEEKVRKASISEMLYVWGTWLHHPERVSSFILYQPKVHMHKATLIDLGQVVKIHCVNQSLWTWVWYMNTVVNPFSTMYWSGTYKVLRLNKWYHSLPIDLDFFVIQLVSVGRKTPKDQEN